MANTGYKYIRATFSNALSSLSEADIEIRNVKTEQLYSVEKVALSTDGYSADITIAGNALEAGTTFLMPATIYSCKIDNDGITATLEFQLPDVWSDMLVTAVNTEKNTITVYGAVRAGGQVAEDDRSHTYNVGDSYDGNLGALVGHTVVMGLDADDNIGSLKVNDGDVVFGYVTAKDGDNDGDFDSAKDYFETVSGDKYYLSTAKTSTANPSLYIWANNSNLFNYMTENDVIDVDNEFEYGKLILNPNGTVSAAVLWREFAGHIIATETDGSVAKETANNSKDFKGYTMIQEDTFDYIDPTDISDGDIIYWDDDVTGKFAFIYNNNVEGTLKTVYEDKLDIDGTKYNFIVWVTTAAAGNIAKQARYYDAANDEYKEVTEKWANTLDKADDVTIFLDTHGDGVLVAGEVGETVTHSKEYIVTQSPKAYVDGLTQMMDLTVSDGTETTLHIAADDITSINGNAFGKVTFPEAAAGGVYNFTIVDNDGKKTGNDGKKDVPNYDDSASDTAVNARIDFQQGSLIDVIFNEDETKVTGLKLKLANKEDYNGTDITLKENDKDVEFKPELTSVKTSNGSLTLSDSTKVYVLTGTRLADGEYANDNARDDSATDNFAEATDNKVKVYDYSDFDKNTQAGTVKLQEVKTEAAKLKNAVLQDSAVTVASRIRFVADKTTAKAVIIDDRGINRAVNTTLTPLIGTVGAATDVPGGQVFKSVETTTKILGVAKTAEYQTNSDGVTMQLATLTILTTEGEIDLNSFKEKLDSNQDVKGKVVLAELDASGKVQALTEFDDALVTTAPVVETVSYGFKDNSTSTTALTVTANAGTGYYTVQPDTDCLVLKFDGTNYTESNVGEINRDSDYVAIRFYTTQLNDSNVKAKVIVADKTGYTSGTWAGYKAVATALWAAGGATTVTAGSTLQVKLLDQNGAPIASSGVWATSNPAVASLDSTTVGSVKTVTGLTVGTTTISVDGFTLTLAVEAPATYTPTATSIKKGTLAVDSSSTAKGTNSYGLGATVVVTGLTVLDQYGVAMSGYTTVGTIGGTAAHTSNAAVAATNAAGALTVTFTTDDTTVAAAGETLTTTILGGTLTITAPATATASDAWTASWTSGS